MPMSEEESLEEQNLVNMILFHEEKLRRIMSGTSAVKMFSTEERRKLRRHGILTFRNKTWGLSEKAREIIENRR